jgi:tRNA(Ser,Leu) C12 N-acetylase TAN1
MSGSNNNNSSSRKRKQGWHSNSGGGGSGGCKNNNGNISGGNNKYNKKRQQPYYHNNPPRGGPGILLTCERSREVKCQREGLDIILHYYNSDSSNVNRSNSNSGPSVNPNPSAAGAAAGSAAGAAAGSAATSDKEAGTASATAKKLTLDEEIATLRQLQKSSSAKGDGNKSNTPPFTIFETGCQGTVFLICTLPNCHLIPPIRFSSSNNKALVAAVGDGDAENDDGKETAGVDDPVDGPCSAEKPAASSATATGKATASTTTNKVNAAAAATKWIDKQQQNDDHEDSITEPVDALSSSSPTCITPPPWDPVEAVQQVARDIMHTSSISRSDSSSNTPPAPSSRFVTRMIPIQATCFASLDEIQATTAALIRNLVLMKNSITKKKEQPQHEQQIISTDDQESSRLDDEEKQQQSSSLSSSLSSTTTFRISIKRRNCAHLKSAQVIAAMGATVASVAPGWKVQLTNSPDYTIWVEICKTLVGISILKSSSSASSSSSSSNDMNNDNNVSTLLRFNFNLHEMKTNQEKSSK